MINEQKNHQAYIDVLECNGPSMPDDDEYMKLYRLWNAEPII